MEKNENKEIREAAVRGRDIGISTKQAIAICKFLRGKTIGQIRKELEETVKFERAVPMTGEIPHRKGMMSGRYPVKAAKTFIKLLKSLEANANAKGMENPKVFGKADKAPRPHRPGRYSRRKFKRTHITLIAKQ